MKEAFSKQTSIGKIIIAQENECITNLWFENDFQNENLKLSETNLIIKAFSLLENYLEGKAFSFEQLPLNPNGTDFQKKVWTMLLKIPYGKTASYKKIARMIENPKAYRAIGNANNKNPLPIFIPCHRIIGYNDKLVGYKGGLKIKKMLLDLEKKYLHKDGFLL